MEITLLIVSFPFSVAALNFSLSLFSKSNNTDFDSSEISFLLFTSFFFFSPIAYCSSNTELFFFNFFHSSIAGSLICGICIWFFRTFFHLFFDMSFLHCQELKFVSFQHVFNLNTGVINWQPTESNKTGGLSKGTPWWKAISFNKSIEPAEYLNLLETFLNKFS